MQHLCPQDQTHTWRLGPRSEGSEGRIVSAFGAAGWRRPAEDMHLLSYVGAVAHAWGTAQVMLAAMEHGPSRLADQSAASRWTHMAIAARRVQAQEMLETGILDKYVEDVVAALAEPGPRRRPSMALLGDWRGCLRASRGLSSADRATWAHTADPRDCRGRAGSSNRPLSTAGHGLAPLLPAPVYH